MNVTVAPRLTSTWVAFGLIAGVTCLVDISASGVPNAAGEVVELLLLMLLVSGFSLGVGLLFGLTVVLLGAKRAIGILGEHVYTIQSDGLREQTLANDTLIRWGGAQKLVRTSALILIRVGPALFHIVPRRWFASNDEYDTFWVAIQSLTRVSR